MNHSTAVLRLHLARRGTMFGAPLGILGIATVISIIILFAVLRATGTSLGTCYADEARWNQAMIWSLPGFLVYLGVATVATTFPFGMSLGSTRRSYVAGTLLAYLTLSAYLTAVMTALLLLELATNHWFIGLYVFDVYSLGAGDPLALAATVFLGSLFMFAMGSVFGAAYVRFRAAGPMVLALGLALVVAALILIVGPGFGPIFASFQLWWLAIAAGVVIVLALGGTYLLLRRASVR